MIHRHRSRSGFTIIELIVVIGIVMILLGLIMPAIVAARRSALAVRCGAQLHQVGQALAAYASANKGYVIPYDDHMLPTHRTRWWTMIFNEPLPKVIVCPLQIDVSNSYALNMWLRFHHIRMGQKLRDNTPSDTVLGTEVLPGVNFLQEFQTGDAPQLAVIRQRHGPLHRSNFLWLDFHVSNRQPVQKPGMRDAFYAHPARIR